MASRPQCNRVGGFPEERSDNAATGEGAAASRERPTGAFSALVPNRCEEGNVLLPHRCWPPGRRSGRAPALPYPPPGPLPIVRTAEKSRKRRQKHRPEILDFLTAS